MGFYVRLKTVNCFAEVLEQHIRKEERVLFEMFDENIPAAEAESLLQQFEVMGHA